MYRIKNTAEDRTKHLLHRTAAKFEIEPSLGGVRIPLRGFIDITDEHYSRVKPTVDEWVKKGMVDVFPLIQPSESVPSLDKWKEFEPFVASTMEEATPIKEEPISVPDPSPTQVAQEAPVIPSVQVPLPPAPSIIRPEKPIGKKLR